MITALILTGILEGIISFGFASALALLLYKTGILFYGIHILPFLFLLFLFGWTVGLVISGLILLLGPRLQVLAWTALQLVAPFSLIYYPREALPNFAQKISYLVPTSYVFEGMREIVLANQLSYSKLLPSLLLGVFYFLLSIIFIFFSYNYIRKKQGLVDLY